MARNLFSFLRKLPKVHPALKEGEMLLGYYEKRGLEKLGYNWMRTDPRVYNQAGLLLEQRQHESAKLIAVIVRCEEHATKQQRLR